MDTDPAKRKAPLPARRPKPAPLKRRRKEQGVPEPTEPKNSFVGIFAKDLCDIMYGFGDSSHTPIPETVDAVESIAIEFVRDVVTKCLENVGPKSKIDVSDIQFVLRKDVRKAQRAQELIIAKERTKKFRNVGKGDNLDFDDIQDSVNVLEDA